jgi:hypothetical protein
MKAGVGHPGQNKCCGTFRTGQLRQDSRGKTAGGGRPGQISRDRTARTWWAGQVTADRVVGIGRSYKSARTGD